MEAIPHQSEWTVKSGPRKPPLPSAEGLFGEETATIPVRMTIWQEGILTGWDDGALGFENDAIWFSGKASSFLVSLRDFRFLVNRNLPDQSMQDHEYPEIPLRHPTRLVIVRLEAIPVDGRHVGYDRSRILNEISRLCEDNASDLSSEYPPLSARPGLRILAANPFSLRLRAVLIGSIFLAIVAVFFAAYSLVLLAIAMAFATIIFSQSSVPDWLEEESAENRA